MPHALNVKISLSTLHKVIKADRYCGFDINDTIENKSHYNTLLMVVK